MIVEMLSGAVFLTAFALLIALAWGINLRTKYKTLMNSFAETRVNEARAVRELETSEELAEHRKTVLDNVVGLILADKNQVPKAIKMMVITETKK